MAPDLLGVNVKTQQMKSIVIKQAVIYSRKRLSVAFDYDPELVQSIKRIPGATFHHGLKCWHIAFSRANLNRLTDIFRGIALLDLGGLKTEFFSKEGLDHFYTAAIPLEPEDEQHLTQFRQWLLFRRYSPSTIRTYMGITSVYLRFIKPAKSSDELGDNFIRFANEYILAKRLSFSYQNQAINALRIFYGKVMKKGFDAAQFKTEA